jgi:hypothetical protein
MDALQFEAVKVSLKQDRTGFILTLSIHPDEIPEDLMRDFVGARYGVAMVRINDDESPVDYLVKKAGMLCRTRDFQVWLQDTGHIEKLSEQAAARAVCDICDVSSRSELSGNTLFKQMVDEYEAWKKTQPF